MNLWLYGAAALPPIMRGCLAPPCESPATPGMAERHNSRCGSTSTASRSWTERLCVVRSSRRATAFECNASTARLGLLSCRTALPPRTRISVARAFRLFNSPQPRVGHLNRQARSRGAAVGSMAVPARRASSAGHPWGRLVCTGTKESTNDRIVDFFDADIKIGRKDECQVQYKGNMTISSVHCKISVENHPETGVQVRIEDTSSNGTYVNTQHLGKHKSCQLSQNDEVRLLTNDAQNEHFGDFVYTFQARAPAASGSAILSRTLLIWRCRVALAGPYARPPRGCARPDVPRARAACTRPRAAVDEQSVQHGVRRDRLPALADRPAEDGRGDVDENPGKPECATAPPPRPRAALPPRRPASTPPRLRAARLRPHARPLARAPTRPPSGPAPPPADAQTMGTLNGALKMGQLDMSEFIEEDGPSALLDVVAEVTCKPKMSWLDLEVLVGALENLWELISNEVDATHI